MAKPKKSDVRKAARRLFRKEKKSKQEVFDILKNRFKNSEMVADVVTYVPSYNRLVKYKALEGLFVGNLILMLVFLVWDYGLQWSQWPFALLLYGVLIRRVDYYLYITLIFSLIALGFVIYPALGYSIPVLEIVRYFIPSITALFLAVFLERKLCPKPQVIKEEVDSKDGKRRYRIKYRFEE